VSINFSQIRETCLKNQQLTRSVIDDFLLYFAADRFNLDREMKKQFSRYRHITGKAPEEWINIMKAQYITHRIFKEGGLINKIETHRALSHLDKQEREFLNFNRKHPWRFSFSIITKNPGEDFYEMEDVFTGEGFLLYSPGITEILETNDVLLWFNLITYNGSCWETYGIIGHYRSFEPEDILFYATQLYPGTWFEDVDELLEFTEKNPIPFMILYLLSNQPLVFNGEDQMVQKGSEFLEDEFDSSLLENTFTVEYADGVYRLSLEDWDQFPHFSFAYYDEKKEQLFLYAMSDRGYTALVDALNDCGYQLPYDSDFRVNMGMVAAVQQILKKDIRLNPYESLFEHTAEPDAEQDEEVERLNEMLNSIIPDINAGRKPDAAKLAQQFNVNEETAREIIDQFWEKYGRTS